MTDEKWLVRKLLQWFKQHKRDFPWRQSKNLYFVLLSEILLKKTRAESVNSFISDFHRKYSSPKEIQKTKLSKIAKDLKPLGLFNQRAVHLKELASDLIERFNGKVPGDKESLSSLPGVGDYTVNAVLSFCKGEPLPIIDTNTVRILMRFFSIVPIAAEARRCKTIWKTAESLIEKSEGEVKEVNLALLDLGALICKARNPSCIKCPLKVRCEFYSNAK